MVVDGSFEFSGAASFAVLAKGGAEVGVYATKGCDWSSEGIRLRRRAVTARRACRCVVGEKSLTCEGEGEGEGWRA